MFSVSKEGSQLSCTFQQNFFMQQYIGSGPWCFSFLALASMCEKVLRLAPHVYSSSTTLNVDSIVLKQLLIG